MTENVRIDSLIADVIVKGWDKDQDNVVQLDSMWAPVPVACL